jgi:hypothetical protein
LRPDPVRKPRPTGTLELVAQLCPTESQMTSIARAFALDPADAASIRDTAEATIANLAKLMESDLGERGLQIFLQRVVGAFVGAAVGAGHVYSNAVSEAQRLSNPLLNDDRDEDRPARSGSMIAPSASANMLPLAASRRAPPSPLPKALSPPTRTRSAMNGSPTSAAMMASSKLPVAPLPPRWPPSASGQRGGAFGLRPWRPRVGSVLKHRALTAAVIDSRDYLAARRRAETELRIPPGTRIAFTGGMPQRRRCRPMIHRSPDTDTGCSGSAGASSGSVSPAVRSASRSFFQVAEPGQR